MGAGDSLVYAYDTRSANKCTNLFRDIHKDSVNCMTLSGNYLFTGSDDKDIVQWDTRSSRPVYVYRGHQGPVRCFSLAEGGKFLFSGSIDMSIRKWDIAYRQTEIEQEEEMRRKFEEQKKALEEAKTEKKGKKDAGKKGAKAKR
jgi:WD40 repeat protein